jgi:hypothetical protein
MRQQYFMAKLGAVNDVHPASKPKADKAKVLDSILQQG